MKRIDLYTAQLKMAKAELKIRDKTARQAIAACIRTFNLIEKLNEKLELARTK